ncbi:tripartite tricarboxylate transporter TctB family protein [Pelobacter seleniigenes]|uniref:tripartite tricarboxylate transporter TctB family protein n=1 Tax=Pelobacter seleniigenes TaxID=407188 RepID=UPI0004A714CB|nr:tripartite tricarboxylate transporter TctB family protein [Pelobacter seleniigenes]
MRQIVQDRFIAVSGLVLVAIGIWITTGYDADSAFFPRICLISIGILLILLAIEGYLTQRKERLTQKQPVMAEKMPWGPFLLVTGVLAAYGIALKIIGFYTSSALFLIAVGLCWGGVKKRTVFLFTICLMVFLYFCFTVLFKVPLPVGLMR